MKTKNDKDPLSLFRGQALVSWRPVIDRVPVAAQSGVLEICGRGFGDASGRGYVYMTPANGATLAPAILEWDDERILLELPGDVQRGTLQVLKRTSSGLIASSTHSFQTLAPGLPSEPYGYRVPVQADSPWPTFRRDHRNTGRSTLQAIYPGGAPWTFKTGKGVFSTPVIDKDENVYVGSGDHYFYALDSNGKLRWKIETGEIIDSAAAIGAEQDGVTPVTFISGDGFMYQVSAEYGRVLWKFEAKLRPEVSFNRWFEGNVAVGFDGTLYAGNTNFYYYAIHPDGTLRWTYAAGSNCWSMAAFGDDGSIYWGSTDTFVHAVSAAGERLWKRMTLGFIAASAAIGSDGTVYIGSFDSNLYALDPNSGKVRWKFSTRDHIYASAALGCDEHGETQAIYFGSADGSLYALSTQGELLWQFEAGDPIRSSPAIGLSESGEQIIYFGCGDGVLYAINADGSFRWAYDTTPEDPELRDRNDLNGSPALGTRGIYIGGEHGYVTFIPYDYPLHTQNDPHAINAMKPLAEDFVALHCVTPGGSTLGEFPESLPPATLITLRMLARQDGDPLWARFCSGPLCNPSDLQIEFDPAIDFSAETSADGRYLHIRPDGFLEPGREYRLRVAGRYFLGGMRIGNLTLGGRGAGEYAQSFNFRVEQTSGASFPLELTGEQTGAFELTRLTVVLPTMMPSLNQLGFDYIDWIAGLVDRKPDDLDPRRGKMLLWVIGARRNADGVLIADPDSDFTLPLAGDYLGDAFILTNRAFSMAVTGIPIPFNTFQLRGRLPESLVVAPGVSTYADTRVLSIPNFGPKMVIAGLANNWIEKLIATGTFITRPYPDSGPSNRRPQELSVTGVTLDAPTEGEPGVVHAEFTLLPGAVYLADEHRAGLLLVDRASGEPVDLDYHNNLHALTGCDGNLNGVELSIPAGTHLPAQVSAYVLADVFPLGKYDL